MVLDKQMNAVLDQYFKELDIIQKDSSNEYVALKNKMAESLSNDIINEMHRLRNFNLPYEKQLSERIMKVLDDSMYEYEEHLHNFVRRQDDIIENNKSKNDLDILSLNESFEQNKLDYDTTKQFDDRKEISMISDRILTHIALKNQYNSNYRQNLDKLELFVREETKNQVKKLHKTMQELYNEYVVGRVNDKTNQLQVYLMTKLREQQLPNEFTEGSLGPILDVEEEQRQEYVSAFTGESLGPILDVEESENAKAFK